MYIIRLLNTCKEKIIKTNRMWIYLVGMSALLLPSVSMALPCSYSFHVSSTSSLNVDPSVSIGSVVGSAIGAFPVLPYDGCGGAGAGQIIGVGTPNGNVYPTTIPGVGYRAIILSNWTAPLSAGYWPTGMTASYPAWFGTGFPAGSLKIEFIKTGIIPAQGGTFGPTPIGYLMVNGQVGATFNLDTPMIINPVTNACTITQSAIPVNLDDVTTGQLTMPGNTAKDKPLTIPLSCSMPVNISLSFNGAMSDSTNGVFQNTNSANANSVGIQLLDSNNNPVKTGSGQYIPLGTVSGNLNYSMTARYYALTSNVAAGAVNAIAYASIVYN